MFLLFRYFYTETILSFPEKRQALNCQGKFACFADYDGSHFAIINVLCSFFLSVHYSIHDEI